MGLLDVARDTLKEIPMADILRERLSLALDQFAEAERQKTTLQSEIGRLTARLENAEVDRDKAQEELKHLQKEHEEEVRIHRCIEFQRGKRTGNKWAAFCPKCHMPAFHNESTIFVQCSDPTCNWSVRLMNFKLSQAIDEL